MTYTITIPSITAAGFGSNPCAVGQTVLLSVSVTELTKILTPEVIYSGEVQAGDIT